MKNGIIKISLANILHVGPINSEIEGEVHNSLFIVYYKLVV